MDVAAGVAVAMVVYLAVAVAVVFIGFSATIRTHREIQWSMARKMLINSIYVLWAPCFAPCFDLH